MVFFKEEKVIVIIDELFDLGVNFKFIEKEVVESFFEGKIVVVIGFLKNYFRIEIKEKLESLGVKVVGSVSKKIDYVIVGEVVGLKLIKV